MPERWEREVRKLRNVEPREHTIRERAARGPSGERRPPRRDALIAGIVAGAVAIAGVAFLGQLDEGKREVGGGTDDLPTLLVAFQRDGFIVDQPDEQVQRVDTTIVYGDAREENFTSTISESAHVDWAGVEDLTRFVPGPTAGSPVRFQADGENARVLIGKPVDWPEFERFTPIERLPAEPGNYVLLFEASYPDGVARTPRLVHVVPRGVLQLAVTEGKSLYAAAALGYLDGRRVDGSLSQSWFTLGDVGAQSDPVAPAFEPGAWLDLPPGSPMVLASDASHARAGLFESYADFDLGDPLPIDLLGSSGVVEGTDGQHLLAVDVSWKKGEIGSGQDGTEERALFFFPIEIVSQPRGGVGVPGESVSPAPSLVPSPSASAGDGGIVVSVFGLGERSDEMPTASFSYNGETKTACTQDFEWTLEDGTKLSGIAETGRPDSIPECAGRAIVVPPGASIAIEAASTTRVFTTRATTQSFEGDVGLVISAEWPDGHATFVVPLTVAPATPDLELVVLDCRPEDQVPITPPETRIEPAGSAYIVGNISGFERSDIVEQMTREAGSDAGDLAGVWQVVRDGTVVASVDYPELSGTACRGSGIGEP
jgi:hypothetical protein